jgi:pilus assembly protein Flp/PilA
MLKTHALFRWNRAVTEVMCHTTLWLLLTAPQADNLWLITGARLTGNARCAIVSGSQKLVRQATGDLLKESATMKNFKLLLNNLATDESGQDLIEYALVAALVGLGAVTAMKSLATSISSVFTSVGTSLTSAV